MSFETMFRAIFKPETVNSIDATIVRNIQAPIAVLGVICGASFGFAGAVMQNMLNNPLASPYTLGISSGASFGAALVIAAGVTTIGLGAYLVPIGAFVFAMIVCGIIFVIANRRNFSATILILAGVGIVQLFSALQSLLQYFIDADTLKAITFWTMGSLEKATWQIDLIVGAAFAVVFALIYRKAWILTAMRLGDTKARSLGIDVAKIRKYMFLLVSILTACAVSFVGVIGFIGIVAPHITRMIVGEDQRYLLVCSALLGGCILELADIISKLITVGLVYPVGTITAIVGLPVFFWLLVSKKRGSFD